MFCWLTSLSVARCIIESSICCAGDWYLTLHDDVIKWKHFPRNWPFVRKIHRSPVNFPHKGQWRGALMFSLIYVWINDWANNREAGDLRRQHGHYDVIVMWDIKIIHGDICEWLYTKCISFCVWLERLSSRLIKSKLDMSPDSQNDWKEIIPIKIR